MKLFLVTGSVRQSFYPNSHYKDSFKDSKVVWATDRESARNAFENFWLDQDVEYSVRYNVNVTDISEALIGS